ncbi:MAG: PH domain-containing protein [Sandaracinaceae bacterium]
MTAPFRTLELDTGAERQIGRFRLLAAAGCVVGAVWLVAIAPPSKGYYCAGAGFAAALMWVGLWARGRRLVRRAGDHGLMLAEEGLTLSTPDKTTTVAWDAIEHIEVDEDRLVVELTTREGAPLSLMPRYGGLGMYELEAAIADAHRQGCASSPASLQLGGPDAPTPPNEACDD